jgi:hypothetical protein
MPDVRAVVPVAHVELQVTQAQGLELLFEREVRVAIALREREARRTMIAVVRALELQLVVDAQRARVAREDRVRARERE